MILTLLKNYPDLIGAKQIFVGVGNGPVSYSQTTLDPVSIPRTSIDLLMADTISVSGTYFAQAKLVVAGNAATWALVWFVTATGLQVGNGVNLSAETVQIGGIYVAA